MSEPLISVIVPVYKVEPYLHQCVESILNQTYQNLEIILVDDGSPDNCPAICDEYAKKDSRIKVVHKQNGGLSSARNAGLDICTGDYIGFVDSDDWIKPEMYEMLMRSLQQYDTDIAICSCYDWYSDDKLKQTKITWPEPTISAQKLVDAILYNAHGAERPGICGVVAWNKLYKKNCFDRLRYDEILKYGEDFWTFIRMAMKEIKCSLCVEPLYFYRIRNSGIMGTTDYLYRSRLAFELADRLCTIAEEQSKYERSTVEHFVVTSFIYLNYSAAFKSHEDYCIVTDGLRRKRSAIRTFDKDFARKYQMGLILATRFSRLFWMISVLRNRNVH